MSNDPLADILIGIGVAAFAWLANVIVKEETGHSIPEHLYGWWCEAKNEILEWQKNHQHLKLTGKVVVFVTMKLDRLAVAPRSIERLFFKAETSTGEFIEITEKDVPMEEALKEFPQLANQTQAPISLTT